MSAKTTKKKKKNDGKRKEGDICTREVDQKQTGGAMVSGSCERKMQLGGKTKKRSDFRTSLEKTPELFP